MLVEGGVDGDDSTSDEQVFCWIIINNIPPPIIINVISKCCSVVFVHGSGAAISTVVEVVYGKFVCEIFAFFRCERNVIAIRNNGTTDGCNNTMNRWGVNMRTLLLFVSHWRITDCAC